MAVIPLPCAGCGGADSGVATALLCDVVDDEVVGTALAVYVLVDGVPGAPSFYDPATGEPYEPVGVMGVCPGVTGDGAPVEP